MTYNAFGWTLNLLNPTHSPTDEGESQCAVGSDDDARRAPPGGN